MLVTFLGTAPGIPQLNRRHSAILFKDEQITFLIDCGEGVCQAFLEEKIGIDELDFIFITHTHPDHISGIYMLLQYFHTQKRKKPLNIYLPEDTRHFSQVLNFMYLFPCLLGYDIILYNCALIEGQYDNISVVTTNHLSGYSEFVKKNNLPNTLYSYGIIIKSNGKKLFYTSDIINVSEIDKYLKDIDFLIIDAIHPKPKEIIDLKDQITEQIFLTHGTTQELISMIKDINIFVITNDKDRFFM